MKTQDINFPMEVEEIFVHLVLPEQFFTVHQRESLRGEQALMRAIIEDAIECFQEGTFKKGRRVEHLAKEAEKWLFSNEERWPFSFVNICRFLDLEPEYIRRGLKKRRKLNST